MFEARPADNKAVDSRAFNAVNMVAGAGKQTVNAASRGAKGIQALICFWLCFVFLIGVLDAVARSNGVLAMLIGLMLGCVVVGGFGYAGVRLMSRATKG